MALLAAALLVSIFALLRSDDDVLVDHTQPERPGRDRRGPRRRARRARRRPRGPDNDKWEVTLRADGTDYEVELAPGTLALLRIDYD